MKILIVVDMLNDFANEAGVLAKSLVTDEYYAQPIIRRVAEKVAEYRRNGWDIIWLGDAHAPDDEEFDRFPAHAVKGTWGAKIIDELNPTWAEESENEIILEKTRYSGFFGTNLSEILARREHLDPTYEVVGVCTSICVMDTVGGLANRDYRIVVDRDCVADFDPEMHDIALNRMENLYGAEIVG